MLAVPFISYFACASYVNIPSTARSEILQYKVDGTDKVYKPELGFKPVRAVALLP